MITKVCPNKAHAKTVIGQYLWIHRWPFNFRFFQCPDCGPVEDEDGLWRGICTGMLWFAPFEGILHSEPHRWWWP